MLSDPEHGFQQQVVGRMDGANRYGHLYSHGIVRIASGFLLQPVNTVVEYWRLFATRNSLPTNTPSLLNHGADKKPGPLDIAAQLDTTWIKAVVNAAQELWLLFQHLGGYKTLGGVIFADLEPFLVAAKVLAEQNS